MCSILFSSKKIESDLKTVNFYNQFRGPDKTTHKRIAGFDFVHNLLSITGTFTEQPLEEDGIIVLFNGEIYNFQQMGDYDNDTKSLIPFYKKYGEEFTKHLDGEFALVLVDTNTEKIIISSDTFRTKPMYWSVGSDIGVSSYKDSLIKLGFQNISPFPANTYMVFDFQYNIVEREEVVTFDLRQYKETFDDWNQAFEESIRKRAGQNIREKLFLGLSSGYDSGAIACEMHKQRIPFKCYTHIGREDAHVINTRRDILSDICEVDQYNTSPADWGAAHDFIVKNTENFMYTVTSARSDYNEFNLRLVDDNGANQFSNLCAKAKSDVRKIHMSGMGADELFSDYGHGGQSKYAHSNFGGMFPDDLTTIYPWNSFYGSTMESYLAKEEYVGGAYGLESRYPFLDKKVVQEFLSLSVELKNKKYKYVLDNYLRENGFPFKSGEKIGF
jgi:asparagine synthetase B (glutamine-hydrolysing)